MLAAAGVTPDMAVADVGVGSGFLALLFASALGPSRRVIAAEISRPFAIANGLHAQHAGMRNLSTVIGTQTEIGLPPNSLDIVFASNVYLLFEQVAAALGSICRVLKPGERFIVIDFEHISGVTSQNALDPVRTGKETVTANMLAAGFSLREEVKSLGLKTSITS